MGILIPFQGTQQKLRLDRPLGADILRIGSIGIVGWFHIWQQSWLPAGELDFLPRSGYVWVDMMILLSAFCLFLPYATDKIQGKEFRFADGFYFRRAIRILPAYFVCLAGHLLVALAQNGWSKTLGLDLLAHLTLTQTWFLQSYWFTQLGGALWTVAVLAGFYLVFPIVAKAMYTAPIKTFGAMLVVQMSFTLCTLPLEGNEYRMMFNRLPAFIGVLGLGMVVALLYAKLANLLQQKWRWLFLLLSVVVLAGIFALLKYSLLKSDKTQHWQLAGRMPLALLFGLLLLLVCLGFGQAKRKGWIAFLSAMTYSFYLWHQSIAVWLKQARIPFWQGEVPPNQQGDLPWMSQYNLLCWLVALAVAAASLLLVEKPILRLFAQKSSKK